MAGGWVYIMTNKPNGTLYIGVTSDIARRVWEHRESVVDGFTKRYGLRRLVYVEAHESIGAAIQREKTMKLCPRQWKLRTISAANPDWRDLFDTLNASAFRPSPLGLSQGSIGAATRDGPSE
jgi:putative endonuclease